jgi:pimeloyl-ACP methyl ester carboxylesterase
MAGRDAAPLLVCVPGLGLDGAAWRPTLRALSGRDRRWRHLVVPLPAYGLRPVAEDDLRPSSLGARLAQRWPAETSVRAVLVGHSASCQVVARAAALLPGLVSALVLVGPTTDPRAASWPGLGYSWVRTAGWERPGQLPTLARTYAKTGLRWMLRAMDAARRDDLRASLREVGCPVLVVRGRHDGICRARWARELVAAAPAGSAMVSLGEGAHMVPLTHGELLAATVGRAVERADAAGFPLAD